MPGFNQNGPMGQKAMSGRRMGRCTNVDNGQQPINNNEEHIEMLGRGMCQGRRQHQRGHGLKQGARGGCCGNRRSN